MSRPLSCYVCRTSVGCDADPRNPLCDGCAPARDHIVSNQIINRQHAAICRCGWRFSCALGDHAARERAIALHWRSVIQAAATEVSA